MTHNNDTDTTSNRDGMKRESEKKIKIQSRGIANTYDVEYVVVDEKS